MTGRNTFTMITQDAIPTAVGLYNNGVHSKDVETNDERRRRGSPFGTRAVIGQNRSRFLAAPFDTHGTFTLP